MHHLKITKKISLTFASVLVAMSAHAEPNEATQLSLTRTNQSGLILQAKLAKNTYRQEPYQADYTVQVPYQDTETYYVDVPYDEQEAYTDYETTYTNDYVCHDYTDYESRCHTERDCNYVPHVGVTATSPLDSIIGRPRDPGGDPGPAPFPGGGTDPRPAPYPDCHDRQVCENVPVTKQNCGYEQTAHQTPVTKYRTVTKYRQEPHTREVTRYRDESRCCVTKYQDVFNHQWGLGVQVQFPQGTELLAAEQESFTVEITGTEAAADVQVTPVKTIFGYQVESKKVDHGLATVVLKMVPRYKADDLKEKTLQNFTAVPTNAGLSYKFLDNALYPRVASSHQVVIQDAITHQVFYQSDVRPDSQREIQSDLAIAWDYTRNYEVILKVHRSGTVIDSGTVDFELRQPLQMVLDMAALKDDSRITASISGNMDNAKVVFKDATVPYSTVSTRYYVTLLRKNLFGKDVVINEKGFSRTSLKAENDGNFTISAKDLGVSSSDMKNYLKSGAKVQVVIQVDRATSDGQKIQFWKNTAITVR